VEGAPHKRAFVGFALGVVCILLAPVLGLVAADKSTNPPGEGPGVLQVILGVGIPAGVAFVVARHVGNRTRARALAWSVASWRPPA